MFPLPKSVHGYPAGQLEMPLLEGMSLAVDSAHLALSEPADQHTLSSDHHSFDGLALDLVGGLSLNGQVLQDLYDHLSDWCSLQPDFGSPGGHFGLSGSPVTVTHCPCLSSFPGGFTGLCGQGHLPW